MKKCFLMLPLLLLIALPLSLHAQIPNPGFEDWAPATQVTPSTPIGWFPQYYYTYTEQFEVIMGSTITRSTTARSGAAAAQGSVVAVTTGLVQGVYPAYMQAIFPLTQRPGELTGYLRYNSVGADTFEVWTVLYKDNLSIPIATGGWGTATSSGSYTKFSTGPLDYVSGETPDSAWIWILVSPSENDTAVHPGTWFLIDDLAFEGTATAIDEKGGTPATFALHQNYPNPFNPTTIIRFELPQAVQVRLSVYNLLGQEVALLVDGQRPAGVYAESFDAAGLPSGTYFYRIEAGSYVQVRKMTVVK
jgi:hypothetical protein